MSDAMPAIRALAVRQRGLSLIELIVFIVIVSVALAGVLGVLNVTAGSSATPMVRKQVIAIAEGMMDEILAKEYSNPVGGSNPAVAGNPTQAERPNFDDVSDYNMTGGWKWTGVTSIDDTATIITGLEAYTISISVTPTTLGGAPMQQVSVTVAGNGETFTLTGYRANY